MKSSVKSSALVGVIFSSVLLTACGGGSGGGDSQPDKKDPVKPPVVVKPTEPTPTDPKPTEPTKPTEPKPTEPEPTKPTEPNTGSKDKELQAGLAVDNFVSMQRQACGIGGYEHDDELSNISNKHGNYLAYLYSNANIKNVNPHKEAGYVGFEDVSGAGNPFFTGTDLLDRVTTAGYGKNNHNVSENIVTRTEHNFAGGASDPAEVGVKMARSLLSAPYHLRSLANPNLVLSGSSVSTYTPFNLTEGSSFGYVLVSTASGPGLDDKNPDGVTTYPCAATTGTNTALYGEAPDPTKGTGRNLRTDPVGQPVHIKMWQAKTIKVSNIKVTDVARKIDIPVQLVDASNDPYKNTYYELPENEAFFMPLTDSLQSCERGTRKNCGLHGNSKYSVSFDVLADNKTLHKKQFTFSTGDVNY